MESKQKEYLISFLMFSCFLDIATTLFGIGVGLIETNVLWYSLGILPMVALKIILNACISVSLYVTKTKYFEIGVGVILVSVGLAQLYYGVHNIQIIGSIFWR